MRCSLLIARHNIGAFEKGSNCRPEIQLAIILFTYYMLSIVNVKRKRGVRNEENYKRSKIKKAKLTGKEHIGHTGRRIAAKSFGPNCR